MALCKKCKSSYPDARKKLGYNVCLKCSSVEPYGCASVINHKTGNSIQIMSKSESKKIRKMQARNGYGTCLKRISS